MGTILDTSVLIAQRAPTGLALEEEVAIAAITASELLHGVRRADARHRVRRAAYVEGILAAVPTIPFSLAVARVHARLWADLAAGRTPGAHDLLIAATALALGWRVATRDRRAFERIPGLELAELR